MKKVLILIKDIIQENREIISYVFFGGCTTLINVLCFAVLYNHMSFGNVVSNVIAWVVAVIFAFYTNKFYVFESRETKPTQQLKEAISFFSCRILTLLVDVAIMTVAIDCLKWNALLWKILSNVIVIILNYIASRFWIFKRKE